MIEIEFNKINKELLQKNFDIIKKSTKEVYDFISKKKKKKLLKIHLYLLL